MGVGGVLKGGEIGRREKGRRSGFLACCVELGLHQNWEIWDSI